MSFIRGFHCVADRTTNEQKIADAEARLQRLKANSRSLDTAQKVAVGAALLAKVRKPEALPE